LYTAINTIFLGIQYKKKYVILPHNKLNRSLIQVFLRTEVAADYLVRSGKIILFFNLMNNSFPIFNSLSFISKPSQRVYLSSIQMQKYYQFNSVYGLVITRYGFLSMLDCIYGRIGGELICVLR
jgi:ribosomal protein S8